MPKKSPIEYLHEPYAMVVVPQRTGRFYAKILEFQGCHSSGETKEQALTNLEEAALLWLESELEQDHEIPAPEQDQKFSGRFLVRTSPALHEELACNAKRQGISLNQYLVQKLSAQAKQDTLVQILVDYLATVPLVQIGQLRFNIVGSTSSKLQTRLQFSGATGPTGILRG